MSTRSVGRVLRIVAGTYQVDVDDRTLSCVLGGRVKQGAGDRVAVGDRVEVETVDGGEGRITTLLPRSSRLARKSVAGQREQVIAANVDQMAAVFALARPEPDLRMLDRLLTLAGLNQLSAFVVVNKMDLVGETGDETGRDGDGPPEAPDGRVPPAFRLYARAGYDVLPTSVPTAGGIDALERRLADRTTVFAGPSGTGKSSLLNALVPDLDRRVGDVSERAGRGRHTTVNATLVPLPGGGHVADTPGLQVLELWEMPPEAVARAFREFRPHLGTCRFNDCRHDHEPGCAVKAAVEGGEIAGSRYESYLALVREAEEQRRTW
ncbi:MAG: ribosome small subunit-dependent GTPase A [Gemmatimonadota bacterium]